MRKQCMNQSGRGEAPLPQHDRLPHMEGRLDVARLEAELGVLEPAI